MVINAATDPDPSLVDAATVAEQFGTDPDRGLSAEEAARRLAAVGPNEIATVPPVDGGDHAAATVLSDGPGDHHDPRSRAIRAAARGWCMVGIIDPPRPGGGRRHRRGAPRRNAASVGSPWIVDSPKARQVGRWNIFAGQRTNSATRVPTICGSQAGHHPQPDRTCIGQDSRSQHQRNWVPPDDERPHQLEDRNRGEELPGRQPIPPVHRRYPEVDNRCADGHHRRTPRCQPTDSLVPPVGRHGIDPDTLGRSARAARGNGRMPDRQREPLRPPTYRVRTPESGELRRAVPQRWTAASARRRAL